MVYETIALPLSYVGEEAGRASLLARAADDADVSEAIRRPAATQFYRCS